MNNPVNKNADLVFFEAKDFENFASNMEEAKIIAYYNFEGKAYHVYGDSKIVNEHLNLIGVDIPESNMLNKKTERIFGNLNNAHNFASELEKLDIKYTWEQWGEKPNITILISY